jgi:hypothetical protein
MNQQILENWLKENHKYAVHLIRTVFWLKEIYPQADEAIEIAALGHDIERAFPLRENEVEVKNNETWDSQEYLLWHGKRSAEFLGKFLRDNRADEELIKKVEDLVAFHEVGGDAEKDAIKDADSISFLENNVDEFIKRGDSSESIKLKIDYMYNRIDSEKAKEFAKPFYNMAVEKLNNI